MLNENWKHFKSGTDIRGVALDGVPGEPVDLTDDTVCRMARGFALFLSRKLQKQPSELRISAGRDSRLSGPRMRDAVVKGLTGCGATVYDCGLASTPAMFMSTLDLPCEGAVQITASHHPFHRNGLKFFTPDGGLESGDIAEILELAQEISLTGSEASAPAGRVLEQNYMSRYAARLRDLICAGVQAPEYTQPLKGLHLVVDAGGGVGGFYATEVLEKLGADISGSVLLEPDGTFSGHIPNPENPDAMACISKAALDAKADFGVIFDTDVDRAACVGADGKEINRNRLVALAAAIALEDYPGGTVVTDSITSDGLKEFIEQHLFGVHCRFKRGYKNVINEALRLEAEGVSAPLAIETSGHAAFKDNYFLDDGAYLMARILIKLAKLRAEGKTPEDLIAALKEPVESKEIRFSITAPAFQEAGLRVLAELDRFARQNGWAVAPDSREGVRISFGPDSGDGWALLRLSVHDPVMPMNVESNRKGGAAVILSALKPFFEGQDVLEAP